MTENKPVAWICEYRSGFSPNSWLTDISEHRPQESETIRNVRPLYEHPPAPQPATDPAVEAARRKALRAIFEALAERPDLSDRASVVLRLAVLRDLVGEARHDPLGLIAGYDPEPMTGEFLSEVFKAATDIYKGQMPVPAKREPLKTSAVMRETRVSTEPPPAPQPDADPAGEAARRKALKAIFAKLEEWPWACDTARGTDIPFGVLRDLVGQPRKYPERAIRSYDNDGPPGPHPVFGKKGEQAPARLSVEQILDVIASAAHPGHTSALSNRVARAVHEAVYGKGE